MEKFIFSVVGITGVVLLVTGAILLLIKANQLVF